MKGALKAAGQPEQSASPMLPPVAVVLLSIASGGVFLWVWALMWGNWIKQKDPASRTSTLAFANIVPGALLYINFPSLLLAMRENDAKEVQRLHIAIILWGTIAVISLIATGITIFLTQRRIATAESQPAR